MQYSQQEKSVWLVVVGLVGGWFFQKNYHFVAPSCKFVTLEKNSDGANCSNELDKVREHSSIKSVHLGGWGCQSKYGDILSD